MEACFNFLAGTSKPSAIPPGQKILVFIWLTILRTDRLPRWQALNRDEKILILLP